jgi:hypothetical protein
MFDTLPTELVDKIMDTKKSLEDQDELISLRRPVDHTDLPLLNEFTFMKHMERIHIDNEYMNFFQERHLLLMFLRASETVIHAYSAEPVVGLIRWIVFSGNPFPYDTESLKKAVEERVQMMCKLFSNKFGIAEPVEAEIVVRRMIKQQITNEVKRVPNFRRVVSKYKKLFQKSEFELRYYNV